MKIELVLKGILPANQSFQGGERLVLSKKAYTVRC
jgi:hypothetical protein